MTLASKRSTDVVLASSSLPADSSEEELEEREGAEDADEELAKSDTESALEHPMRVSGRANKASNAGVVWEGMCLLCSK